MVTLYLVQRHYAEPADVLADAYDLTLAGYAAERADGGTPQEAPMSTPEDLALEALSVQARLVAKLRAAKAEGDAAWERTRQRASEPGYDPEDDQPEPWHCRTCDNPDLGPRYCGTDTCTICGEAIDRHASAWWHCHGGRDHMPRPALTWLEIEDRWAEWKADDEGGDDD